MQQPRLLGKDITAEGALGIVSILARLTMGYAKLMQRLVNRFETGCCEIGHRRGKRYGRAPEGRRSGRLKCGVSIVGLGHQVEAEWSG